MEKRIRVLIVDDHPVVRDGLRGMFAGDERFEVVGEASNGAEALAETQRAGPDVVLMDLRMPAMGGVEAIRRLCTVAPSAHVLVLTTYDSDEDVLPAIEAGATGYLLKDAPRAELMHGVLAAATGESVLAPSVAGRVLARMRGPQPEALSQRELEVLRLVANGSSTRDVAASLFVSEATVKTHLLHIYTKLGVRERAAAVGEAYRRHLLP
jgi:DNA-binding NarL/FixJ family response regulator